MNKIPNQLLNNVLDKLEQMGFDINNTGLYEWDCNLNSVHIKINVENEVENE